MARQRAEVQISSPPDAGVLGFGSSSFVVRTLNNICRLGKLCCILRTAGLTDTYNNLALTNSTAIAVPLTGVSNYTTVSQIVDRLCVATMTGNALQQPEIRCPRNIAKLPFLETFVITKLLTNMSELRGVTRRVPGSFDVFTFLRWGGPPRTLE